MRIIAAVIIVVAGVVVAVGGAYWLALRAQQQAERALCPAFALLTRHRPPYPSDPAANPSRLQSWQLYMTFRQIESNYRCPR